MFWKRYGTGSEREKRFRRARGRRHSPISPPEFAYQKAPDVSDTSLDLDFSTVPVFRSLPESAETSSLFQTKIAFLLTALGISKREFDRGIKKVTLKDIFQQIPVLTKKVPGRQKAQFMQMLRDDVSASAFQAYILNTFTSSRKIPQKPQTLPAMEASIPAMEASIAESEPNREFNTSHFKEIIKYWFFDRETDEDGEEIQQFKADLQTWFEQYLQKLSRGEESLFTDQSSPRILLIELSLQMFAERLLQSEQDPVVFLIKKMELLDNLTKQRENVGLNPFKYMKLSQKMRIEREYIDAFSALLYKAFATYFVLRVQQEAALGLNRTSRNVFLPSESISSDGGLSLSVIGQALTEVFADKSLVKSARTFLTQIRLPFLGKKKDEEPLLDPYLIEMARKKFEEMIKQGETLSSVGNTFSAEVLYYIRSESDSGSGYVEKERSARKRDKRVRKIVLHVIDTAEERIKMYTSSSSARARHPYHTDFTFDPTPLNELALYELSPLEKDKKRSQEQARLSMEQYSRWLRRFIEVEIIIELSQQFQLNFDEDSVGSLDLDDVLNRILDENSLQETLNQIRMDIQAAITARYTSLLEDISYQLDPSNFELSDEDLLYVQDLLQEHNIPAGIIDTMRTLRDLLNFFDETDEIVFKEKPSIFKEIAIYLRTQTAQKNATGQKHDFAYLELLYGLSSGSLSIKDKNSLIANFNAFLKIHNKAIRTILSSLKNKNAILFCYLNERLIILDDIPSKERARLDSDKFQRQYGGSLESNQETLRELIGWAGGLADPEIDWLLSNLDGNSVHDIHLREAFVVELAINSFMKQLYLKFYEGFAKLDSNLKTVLMTIVPSDTAYLSAKHIEMLLRETDNFFNPDRLIGIFVQDLKEVFKDSDYVDILNQSLNLYLSTRVGSTQGSKQSLRSIETVINTRITNLLDSHKATIMRSPQFKRTHYQESEFHQYVSHLIDSPGEIESLSLSANVLSVVNELLALKQKLQYFIYVCEYLEKIPPSLSNSDKQAIEPVLRAILQFTGVLIKWAEQHKTISANQAANIIQLHDLDDTRPGQQAIVISPTIIHQFVAQCTRPPLISNSGNGFLGDDIWT